jgi:hypothetical protein
MEIWNQIFTLACTDNGFTGRSLSLVSRYIHKTSKSAKLQSLSVTKPQQIHALARLIAETPPKYRRVRYLFIASPGPYDDESDDREADSEEEGSNTSAADAADHDKEVLAAFQHIIRALAPTLTTLHVHFPFYRESLFLPTTETFPSLVELTLYGPYSIELPSLSDHPPLFPSLRRLHLADCYCDSTGCYGRIANVAPLLTHLCLPYQSSMADSLLAGLRTRVISRTHSPTSSSDSHGFAVGTLPSTIEMVLIDPGPPYTRIGWCGTGLMRHYMDQQRFREAMKVDKRVYMLKERPNGVKDAEKYWLDRIEGGEGSWAVHPNLLACTW